MARDFGVTSPAVSNRIRRVCTILGAKTPAQAVAMYLAPEKYRKP